MLKIQFYLHHKPALFLTAPYCPSEVPTQLDSEGFKSPKVPAVPLLLLGVFEVGWEGALVDTQIHKNSIRIGNTAVDAASSSESQPQLLCWRGLQAAMGSLRCKTGYKIKKFSFCSAPPCTGTDPKQAQGISLQTWPGCSGDEQWAPEKRGNSLKSLYWGDCNNCSLKYDKCVDIPKKI